MIIYNQTIKNGIPQPLSIEINGGILRYNSNFTEEEREDFFMVLEDYKDEQIEILTFIGDEKPKSKKYILHGVTISNGLAGLKLSALSNLMDLRKLVEASKRIKEILEESNDK